MSMVERQRQRKSDKVKEREREAVRHNKDLTNGPQKGGETLSHLFVVGATVVVGATATKKQRERRERQRADFSHMNAEEKCQHHLGKE